ncbi:efflux RND transporter periplasmic adaptor subunit [Azospirillum sp.]|uniref:efflux RND transporter periplasmic adaptor subunit n=1 Tax=Azospirillum sp. TaxID=34012 RepID=UPI002D2D3FD9|nr:efflux RND transporter periplasmic adaptor subunit [Azospirillum sp.]HYD65233.1 efflux RND transporter periplasmic adaptor subunit [Azospirillum sp.]
MIRRLATLLVLVLLAVAAVAGYLYLDRAEAAPSYRTAKVEQGPLVSAITATGTLNAVVTVEVSSQLSGQIAQVHADFNSAVKVGQVLANLDDTQLKARLASAQADLEASQATFNVQQAQLEKSQADVASARANVANTVAAVLRAELAMQEAERDLARREDLRGRGVVAAADLEKAQTAFRTARAQMTSAQAQRQQAEAAVASAEASARIALAQVEVARANVLQRTAAMQLVQVDIDRSVIRSPIDGVVVDRQVNVGQTVAASLQAPKLFNIAQDLRQMRVLANIDEADIGRVREGLSASFTVGAYPGETFHGTVAEVRLAPETQQNVVTYIVAITVENAELRLLPGMTTNLRVAVDERANAVKVPNAALRFRPMGTAAPADTAAAPVTVAPAIGAGRGAASVEAMVRRLDGELTLDDKQRTQIDRILAQARERFTALGSRDGDAERRRAEAREIRRSVEEGIAAVLDTDQRARFDALKNGGTTKTVVTPRTVWVVGADGQPQAVQVRAGISDGSFTEVVGGGLAPGQEVIVGMNSQAAANRGPRLAF